MVLLHVKDNHLNLIVSDNSDLAKLGSLYQSFSIGPSEDTKDTKDGKSKERKDEVNQVNMVENDVAKLKKELKQSRESKDYIRNGLGDPEQCQNQLIALD